ncbi:helix-turn-helix transcriptional regulator [Shewanella sp. 1_MG-2023]|uniref:helix-turn-helix domain-containing protein n=1 Tax=unclassified Shewanella TaxID=196818 RepID=UPI0026E17492|nr:MULTISPECIES: helix-turn-helix transcriptional regulator [unclassified Shewanella]MDO6612980.1 helix-turn-helix transcriptional regulator [Shewanella sp. 7_MG-2023]MDO6772840.1 helix-turn-helix transcriptional regulator [Shewanella sp. 2_MG-2023]MDO6795112.1 helix-turn-helix transcriptional regulator [Shewanella sp. 1_MG-2023]
MNTAVLTSFGAHVRQIRQSLDISQEELAAISGLDRTYISGIERGVRNLSLLNIFKLAAALKVTPASLLTFEIEISNA